MWKVGVVITLTLQLPAACIVTCSRKLLYRDRHRDTETDTVGENQGPFRSLASYRCLRSVSARVTLCLPRGFSSASVIADWALSKPPTPSSREPQLLNPAGLPLASPAHLPWCDAGLSSARTNQLHELWQRTGEETRLPAPCSPPALCLSPCHQRCSPSPPFASHCWAQHGTTTTSGHLSGRFHQNSACLGGKSCDCCPWNNSPSLATWVFPLIRFARRRLFCFHCLCFELCFCFTSVSCSDIDVFLWKSSCASGFLFSFMT